MREKLINILSTAGWNLFEGGEQTKREIADHLIASGVTILKWIPVTERLPEDEGWYQVYTAPDKGYKSINKARFCKGFEWDNFTPHWHGAGGTWGNVTHWMPLPEPPKEVE